MIFKIGMQNGNIDPDSGLCPGGYMCESDRNFKIDSSSSQATHTEGSANNPAIYGIDSEQTLSHESSITKEVKQNNPTEFE